MKATGSSLKRHKMPTRPFVRSGPGDKCLFHVKTEKSVGSSFCRKAPLKLQNEDPRVTFSLPSPSVVVAEAPYYQEMITLVQGE